MTLFVPPMLHLLVGGGRTRDTYSLPYTHTYTQVQEPTGPEEPERRDARAVGAATHHAPPAAAAGVAGQFCQGCQAAAAQ